MRTNVTVIFSRDSAVWGSFFYDPAADALRVDVRWQDAPFREQLVYEFSDITAKSAVLALAWEKKRIPIPISVETTRVVLASLKDELRNAKGFSFQAWVDASNYLLTQNIELPLALRWADTAVGDPFVGQRNFATLSHRAKVLEKIGRAADAQSAMNEALPLGTAIQIHQYGSQLIAAGQGARALEVFQLNVRLHPDIWPVNYGLARGYSAVGDYPAALVALLKAQTQLPAGDAVNASAIQANIEKLKRGENIN